MNKLMPILLIAFMSYSCNKINTTLKKLEGNWKVIEYKVTNAQGLTYFYDAQGTWCFKNCNGNECEYHINLQYPNQGVVSQKVETGIFQMEEDGEHYTLLRVNENGSITTIEDGRIIMLTNNDVKTIFIDEYGMHQFILEK
ncbi:MAG TPA: hypothetical protein EYN64_00355 [Flavobacteriales bacterium]|nr:hypothetical protein [Flavobacteriales bacterium]